MDSAKLTLVKDDVFKRLDAMVANSMDARGVLNRVIYPMYQNAQIQRWISEGSSEGSAWKPLNPLYASYKKRRYGGGTKYKFIGGRNPGPWQESGSWPSYPGGGTKTLIATGVLVGSVIGPNDMYSTGTSDHRKLVDSHSLQVYTVTPYAMHVAEVRPFMKFSDQTLFNMRAAIKKYMRGTF